MKTGSSARAITGSAMGHEAQLLGQNCPIWNALDNISETVRPRAKITIESIDDTTGQSLEVRRNRK